MRGLRPQPANAGNNSVQRSEKNRAHLLVLTGDQPARDNVPMKPEPYFTLFTLNLNPFLRLREWARPLLLATTRIPSDSSGKYTREDIDREYTSKKPSAPFCTVSCVHRVAMLDLIRNEPREALFRFFPADRPGAPLPLPPGVRLLTSIFLPPPSGQPRNAARRFLAGAVLRAFGVKTTTENNGARTYKYL
jgi:hypothetical protein